MTLTILSSIITDDYLSTIVKHTVFILITLLSCGLSATAGTARAQRSVMFRTYSIPVSDGDKLQNLRDELKYYRKMQATGAGLTATGLALAAAGQGLLWSSVALNEAGRRSYAPVARDPMWLAGLGTTLLSAIPFAFGIPLLRYGTHKVKELKMQLPKKQLLQ